MASRWAISVHIMTIFLIDFLAFFLSSSVLLLYMYTASKCVSTSSPASAFAWVLEWPPICPRAHEAAPLTRSSGIWISESLRAVTPLP